NVAGAPADITAFLGNEQRAPMGGIFSNRLQAQVIDSFGNPVSGALVTFTEIDGDTGAGATFPGKARTALGLTNAQGVAYAPALTANNVAGSFSVTASVGTAASTSFYLTVNKASPRLVSTPGGAVTYGTGAKLSASVTLTGASNPTGWLPSRFM